MVEAVAAMLTRIVLAFVRLDMTAKSFVTVGTFAIKPEEITEIRILLKSNESWVILAFQSTERTKQN